jgi:hypothetical protein
MAETRRRKKKKEEERRRKKKITQRRGVARGSQSFSELVQDLGLIHESERG